MDFLKRLRGTDFAAPLPPSYPKKPDVGTRLRSLFMRTPQLSTSISPLTRIKNFFASLRAGKENARNGNASAFGQASVQNIKKPTDPRSDDSIRKALNKHSDETLFRMPSE